MRDFKVGDKVKIYTKYTDFKNRFNQILVVTKINDNMIYFGQDGNSYFLYDYRLYKVNIQRKLK